MIYLDNAASSWPKPAGVIRAARDWFGENGANPGRSPHRPGRTASRAIRETRRLAAALLGGVDPDRVVFTSNATHALNIALKGGLEEDDHVLTSLLEHNSILRPLHQLREERGIAFTGLEPEPDGRLDPGTVADRLRPETRMVAISHASNVLGTVQPVAEIARAVRGARGDEVRILVDAAQSAGVLELPVREWGIDLLALAGQKGLFGLQGTGVLYVREGVDLRPFVTGGTGSRSDEPVHPRQMPDRLEAGTTNTPGLVALGAGLRFLEETGQETIRRHEAALGDRLRAGLRETEGVELYGPPGGRGARPRVPAERAHDAGNPSGDDGVAPVAVVSFNVGRADPERVAFELDRRHGFAVRPGVHCAPWTHRWLGTLQREPQGAVRASPGYFNDEGQIDEFVAAVAELAREEREPGVGGAGRGGRGAARGTGRDTGRAR